MTLRRTVPPGWTPVAMALDGFAAEHHGLRVIASWGGGWEHVSVSLERRVPLWEEMCFVKRAFWGPEDAVMQIHPAESRYVNCHPFCLHLWRPVGAEIPLPPAWMVGPLSASHQ